MRPRESGPAATLIKIVFIGWGAINSRVGELLRERSSQVEIAAIATTGKTAPRTAFPAGARAISASSSLAEIKPDLIVEAAGRAAVEIWAPLALQHSKALIVASTSAFTDGALLPRLSEIAERNASRILIPSGAIGAIDALASAAILGLDEVLHQIVKPPQAWQNTAAEQLIDLANLSERKIFFSGSARDAARDYPQNANATVVTALAGAGLDRTLVELVADPAVKRNQHRIMARGPFGQFDITLENEPLRTNPKSSELTALSLMRLIEKQTATIVL